jgi:hypothetical protein
VRAAGRRFLAFSPEMRGIAPDAPGHIRCNEPYRPLQDCRAKETFMRTARVALISFLLTSLGALGCAVEPADSEHDEESETESTDEALRSVVDCTERDDTAYTRGAASPIKVITIGGKKVSKPTGHAFLKMQQAADAAGVSLSLTSGFRTMAEQRYLYGCYVNGNCNNGNLAAKPGYSNHQNGLALDLSTSTWLANNAARFGFVRTVPSEAWHYEYTGKSDPGGPCGGNSQALPWVSPLDNGVYKNGIWMKVSPKSGEVTKVVYFAEQYMLGESTDKAQSFAFKYTFTQTGARTLTAKAYDAAGKLSSTSSVSIKVVD